MNLRRKSVRFFLMFLLTFGALIGTWRLVGGAYGSLFRGAGSVLSVATGTWTIKYVRQLDQGTPHDTLVRLRNRQNSLKRDIKLSSRRMAYMPTVFLIALTIATPVPWVRKRIAILCGLVGVHLFIAVRLALVPATYIAKLGEENSETILTKLDWVFSGSSAGWAIVPLIIWVVVTLKYALPVSSPNPPQPVADNNPS